MIPIDDLEMQLSHAKERHVFGTGMRSVIHGADVNGIQAIVDQQFALLDKLPKLDWSLFLNQKSIFIFQIKPALRKLCITRLLNNSELYLKI